MPDIRNKDGKIIHTSRNLAGIRRFVNSPQSSAVKVVALDHIGKHKTDGKLSILFVNGDNYETNFGDFNVLCGWVSRWRALHGVPLKIDGVNAGKVDKFNPPYSMPVCEWCGLYVDTAEKRSTPNAHISCALANSDD